MTSPRVSARYGVQPMNLVFFEAALPLTKTIVGTTVAPYPHVSKLTSHHESIGSLDAMFAVLKKHAALGHCLFNGQLTVPLTHESRAGKTIKGIDRVWLVFDFDKVACDSVDELLPPACKDVSYIIQRSTSMFVSDQFFSGHVFMLLERPSNEKELKEWFERINFDNPILKSQLALTGSKTALHWPLDRSGAYDSKLIYIAPPKLVGVQPLLLPEDAIQIVKRRRPRLTIPSFDPVPKYLLDKTINDLRVNEGLPQRDLSTRPFQDGEILLKADKLLISGVKNIGEHYIKFNVGDGDSMAYWIDLRNPQIVKNFKGEPYMKTEEVDPEFFKVLVKEARKIVQRPPIEDGTEILAFFSTADEAEVTTGLWCPLERYLRLDKSNLSAAAAWLAAYGIMKHGYLDHYDVVFDPTDLSPQYISARPYINRFSPTEYMLKTKSSKPSTIKSLPPVIGKTLHSIVGGNDELLEHFINWLAFIFQTRTKTETAWVLHGIEGIGKGNFVDYILRPLFGKELVRNVQFGLASGMFNDFLDGALFVVFEESSMSAVNNQADLMQKLRHWITEDSITINAKNKKPIENKNYSNLIFYSNERNVVQISGSNRRFNVCPRQEEKIFYTPNEFLALQQLDELHDFAQVLTDWPVNEQAVHTIINTEAAAFMHEMTSPISAQIAEAILRGDIQYFIDRQPSDLEAMADFGAHVNTLSMYKDVIDKVLAGSLDVLEKEHLYALFRTLLPDPRFFSNSPRHRDRFYAQNGINVKQTWSASAKTNIRGIKINWQRAERPPHRPLKNPAKVVPIK